MKIEPTELFKVLKKDPAQDKTRQKATPITKSDRQVSSTKPINNACS